MNNTAFNILTWALRLVAAVILLQTLYFKFTGAAESVYIFSTLGAEPYGRIGVGVMELIASILILIPRTTTIGSILAVGLMGGALMAHFTKLGIVVQNDGGELFILCLTVLVVNLVLLVLFRKQIPFISRFFA